MKRQIDFIGHRLTCTAYAWPAACRSKRRKVRTCGKRRASWTIPSAKQIQPQAGVRHTVAAKYQETPESSIAVPFKRRYNSCRCKLCRFGSWHCKNGICRCRMELRPRISRWLKTARSKTWKTADSVNSRLHNRSRLSPFNFTEEVSVC